MPDKDPRITVTASAELMQQLLAADTALKHSRGKARQDTSALHALIVQVATARARAPQPLTLQEGPTGE